MMKRMIATALLVMAGRRILTLAILMSDDPSLSTGGIESWELSNAAALATCVSSVLLLTGLTRDGVYLVEDGEVTAAVNNFRFNESPLDLVRRATQAGVSEFTLPREWGDWATRDQMPSLRIPDFHMSSVSQAQ